MVDAEYFVTTFIPIVTVFVILHMATQGGGPQTALDALFFANPLGYFLIAVILLAPSFFISNLLPGAKILFFATAILWIISARGIP